jgi:2-amino-4-hydroxy-6-hydroxymethyldihydropteridine diphosphokinase
MKNTVRLSLGSNIGDKKENILSALSLMQSSSFINIKKISNLYKTSPVGKKQSDFCNAVVKAKTNLNPQKLLPLIKSIEFGLGRKKTFRRGPRIIDIDILFFNNKIINSKLLVIPHKEICNRLFVLVPLCEIDKKLKHPILNSSIKQILQDNLLRLKKQKIKLIK